MHTFFGGEGHVHAGLFEVVAASFERLCERFGGGLDLAFRRRVDGEVGRAFVVVLVEEAVLVPLVQAKEDQLGGERRGVVVGDHVFLGLHVGVFAGERHNVLV